MTRKPRALTRQFERLIETALMPGRFVAYNASFSFVRGLEAVEQRLAKDLSMDPAQAALYETFLAGCYEKAEEIDDSSGSFGQFVGELHCAWVKAGQAAGARPNDIATQLVAWMEADAYGFCHDLEKGAAKVLNTAGLTALVNQIRHRFDAAGATRPVPGESFPHNAVYARRRWGDALRTLYLAQKDVEAYLAFAQQTGLTAADCHALATIFTARRNANGALRWVERGIELAGCAPNSSMAGYQLATFRRDLLAKLGRGHEAREAAWAEYCEHPSTYAYDDLMKYVPKAERAAWHHKAIEAAKGSDLDSPIELLLKTKELERLASLVRGSPDEALENVSHYVTEPAAKKLEKIHPDVAARLWCAQGTGFEEIVAGSGPSQRPSFLQRAKARWT